MPKNPLDAAMQLKIRIAVKKYLQANKLNELRLAEMMGLKPQTVINYLSSADISPKTVKKISEALGYPYDLLIQGEYWEGETKMKELERRIKALEDFVYRGETR